jgi:polyisoprenoid-binding protein YceI
MRSPALPIVAAALLATSAVAQAPTTLPGSPDTRAITAGSYKIEPNHTQVMFAVDHMGFSIFRGFLSQAAGTLVLDPARAAAAQLSVTIPVASIRTTLDKLDGELVSADWLDAGAFPTATFVSTKVTPGPGNIALVDGNLTLHGVTRPAQMRVHFHGAGVNPNGKAAALGFDARLTFNRSEFSVTKLLAVVSDHIEVTIAAAFEKQ